MTSYSGRLSFDHSRHSTHRRSHIDKTVFRSIRRASPGRVYHTINGHVFIIWANTAVSLTLFLTAIELASLLAPARPTVRTPPGSQFAAPAPGGIAPRARRPRCDDR